MDDWAGVTAVQYTGDTAHSEIAADAEGEVPDEFLPEVFRKAFEESIVTGRHIALKALGVFDGDPLCRRVAIKRSPLGDVLVLLFGKPWFRSRRIPVSQSESAAVELSNAHPR